MEGYFESKSRDNLSGKELLFFSCQLGKKLRMEINFYGKDPNLFGRDLNEIRRVPNQIGRYPNEIGKDQNLFGRGKNEIGRGPNLFRMGINFYGLHLNLFGRGKNEIGRGQNPFRMEINFYGWGSNEKRWGSKAFRGISKDHACKTIFMDGEAIRKEGQVKDWRNGIKYFKNLFIFRLITKPENK